MGISGDEGEWQDNWLMAHRPESQGRRHCLGPANVPQRCTPRHPQGEGIPRPYRTTAGAQTQADSS